MKTFALCLMVTCVFGNEIPSKLVNTAQGPVRGYKDPDYDVYAFRSIPYATAPTGVYRFKAPLPPPYWEEPLEAVNKGIICPQVNLFDILPDTLNVEEDCLIANIYIPDTDAKSIPVAVYVHGGAFAIGFGDMIDPREMVNTKKLLVVTFNYRLGAHGFLCLGTEAIPGNAGMKDQVALLRWVQNNIGNFGGDPNDVTIVGSSAGSASVDLLMVSKMAKGLFKKVIPESGANTASFAVQTHPVESAKYYADMLNADIDTNDIYTLEEFFTQVSLQHLNSIMFANKNDSTLPVGPCLERNIGEEMFLTESPFDILKKGDYEKLPMLYGFTNMEGLMRIFFNRGEVLPDLKSMNDDFSSYLPGNLQFRNENERNEVMKKIKTHFFGTHVDEEDILDYVDYFSDTYFAQPTLMSVKLQVEAGNNQIYLYEYSFTDESDPTSLVPFTKVRGANHCAQSTAVWGSALPFNNFNKSEAYENNRKTVQNMWLNFITTGNPTPEGSNLPEWPPVGRKWSPHMSLGRAVELRGSLLKERALFWEEIYAQHYRSPQPPPPPPPKRTEL